VKESTVAAIRETLEEDPSLSEDGKLRILDACKPSVTEPDSRHFWPVHAISNRETALDRIFARPLWDENDVATVLGVAIDTVRHMKSRNEIPGVVQVNQRCWRIHRDAFLEHFKENGMPRRSRGRPRKTAEPPE